MNKNSNKKNKNQAIKANGLDNKVVKLAMATAILISSGSALSQLNLSEKNELIKAFQISTANAASYYVIDTLYDGNRLNYYYEEYGGEVVITNYNGVTGANLDIDLRIPAYINNTPVTGIGQGVFNQNGMSPRIFKLTLPNTIKGIGGGAFGNQTFLKEVTLPESVEEISDTSFYWTNSMEKVTILNPNLRMFNDDPRKPNFFNDPFQKGYGYTDKKLTVYGHDPSTAKDYALKFGHKFVAIDTAPPSIELTPNTWSPTNKTITVTANITDNNAVSVKKWAVGEQDISYFASKGTTLGASFNVTTNGVYTVYAKDSQGNEAIKTITINNIDKIAPSIPTLSPSTSNKTNQSVFVNISYPVDAKVKEYKIGSGAWMPYTSEVEIVSNSTVRARAIDESGNISSEGTLTINNIDLTPPSKPTLKLNKTVATMDDVVVTITYSSDSVLKQYKIDNGNWFTYSGPITISENSTISARAYDEAQNVSLEGVLVITNIDRIAPDGPTFGLSSTQYTKDSLKLTITYPTDVTVKQYSLNGGSSWLNYSGSITLNANGTVIARGKDTAGNMSVETELVVLNIDKVAPVVSSIELIGDKLNVEASDLDSGIQKIEVSINNGLWQIYEVDSIAIEETSTVRARATDKAGNISTIISKDIEVKDYDYEKYILFISKMDEMKIHILSGLATKESILPIKDELKSITTESLKFRNTTLQTDIEKRVKALQDVIELLERIWDKIENQKLDDAEELANQLPPSNLKEQILEKINEEQEQNEKLKVATASVVKAEGSMLQADVNSAKALVNGLPNGTEKTNLANRLNTLQKAIDDAKALAEQIETATASVVKAEGSKLQADVDSAKGLVTALPNGTEKTNLTNRLNTVQKAIDDAKGLTEQIATATASVVKAESSKLQVDVDTAKILVNGLPNGTEKTNLTNRLNTVQKAIDDAKALAEQIETATASVVKAESSKTQVDVNAAGVLVNALPNGIAKTELLARLNTIQLIIDMNKLIEETEKDIDDLGDSPTQEELDKIKEKIEELTDGPAKDILLDIIKEKQEELNLKNLIMQIALATEAVEKAELSRILPDINAARKLVNKLPDGDVKTELTARLDNIQKSIDGVEKIAEQFAKAEAAVTLAENYPTNYNLANAIKLVSELPENEDKEDLLNRIQKLQDVLDLDKAEKKVIQAEQYQRDPYLSDAIKLVDALKESNSKQELKDRLQFILDKLKSDKDKEDEAKEADGNFDPTNPDSSIEDAINTIQDPEAKKFFTKWNKANNNAYKYFSRAMTLNAVKVKDELPASYSAKASYTNLIAELTTRTNNLATAWEESSKDKATEQLFSKAYTLVDLYESSKNERNYKNAETAIKALPEGDAKVALQKQLESMKKHPEEENSNPTHNSKEAIEQAEKAVANYEKYKSSYYQKKALEAIDTLIESDEKTAFQLRLSLINK